MDIEKFIEVAERGFIPTVEGEVRSEVESPEKAVLKMEEALSTKPVEPLVVKLEE